MRAWRFAAFVVVLASSVAAQNLLTNPNFTTGVDGWGPPSWITWIGNDGYSGGSGPGCAEVDQTALTGDLYGIVQLIPVTAGTTYAISGWAFIPPAADNLAVAAELAVQWMDDSTTLTWSFVAATTTRGQWVRISGVATAPAGATQAYPRFGVRVPNSGAGTSRVRWDDVSFGPSAPAAEYYVPAAGNNHGKGGTYWTTDLAIHNPLTVALKVEAAYLSTAGDNSAAPFVTLATLAPGATATLANVVATMGYSTSGTIRVRCSASAQPQAIITAHTTTPAAAGGSYGQGAAAQSAPAGTHFAVSGLVENAAFRTNVGLVNTTAAPVSARLRVLRGDGSVAADQTWTLGAFGWRQDSLPTLGVSSLDGGTLLVDGAGVLAYATPVDWGTGDSVYLPAVPLS